MNFGEDLELDADNDVVGVDTGRVVAKFSHHAEAESFVKFYNNKKKQLTELTAKCEKMREALNEIKYHINYQDTDELIVKIIDEVLEGIK